MKSDLEKLRDLCNSTIEDEKRRNFTKLDTHIWKVPDYSRCEIIMRLGDYIILKPKKDS